MTERTVTNAEIADISRCFFAEILSFVCCFALKGAKKPQKWPFLRCQNAVWRPGGGRSCVLARSRRRDAIECFTGLEVCFEATQPCTQTRAWRSKTRSGLSELGQKRRQLRIVLRCVVEIDVALQVNPELRRSPQSCGKPPGHPGI